jgi:hypothetical protein
MLLLFLTLVLHAQNPPTDPTLILVADGDLAEYSFISKPPSNWHEPDFLAGWETAPTGFGGTSRATEVSTVASFPEIRLRQRFDLVSSLVTLTLSLKQDDADLEVYLNGVQILNLGSGQLPPTDPTGYRNYDFSSHIPSLVPAGNLLGIYSKGRILTPILHGTTFDKIANSIAVDATQTRLIEGGPSLPIRVFRLSPTSPATRLFIPSATPAFSPNSDFLVKLDGVALPFITNDKGRYFQIPFSDEEAEKIIELEIIDDIHAEGNEAIELKSFGPATRFVVTRNDTIVTRTTAQGEGSLRQAIENAKLNPGNETIRFSDSEGVPFSKAPVTVHLDSGTPGRYGLREGFIIEGPASPGRVTIQASGGPLFRATGGGPSSSAYDLTLRRLVIRGSSLVIESPRYRGTILMEDCEFVDNDQVLALDNRSSSPKLRRCLFFNNKLCMTHESSGLRTEFENCTFTSNTSMFESSAVKADFVACTFSDQGGYPDNGRWTMKNSLLVGQAETRLIRPQALDEGGNLFALNHPLDRELHDKSSLVSVSEAGIGTLGFHGGFTRTIPILPTSPALDLGLQSDDDSPQFDQRGKAYSRRVGPSPDAGAFELQLVNDAVLIGVTTDVTYDSIAGLYFQFVFIHNQSPWTLSDFRLQVEDLPEDAFLYNASGAEFIEISRPLSSSDYQIVVIQYAARRPDLLLLPTLSLVIDSSAADPYRVAIESPDLVIYFDGSASPCLTFRTEPGEACQVQVSDNAADWLPMGPALFSESNRLIWKDPDEARPEKRLYRVSRSNKP